VSRFSVHFFTRTNGWAATGLNWDGRPAQDGWLTVTGTIPRSALPGDWEASGLHLVDDVGRTRNYYAQLDGSYTTSDGAFSGPPGTVDIPAFRLTQAS
jgi:hypothetical protein